MLTTKLAATLAVLAATTIAPSIATAATPPAPQKGISHAQPWLDWGNSLVDATKSEITIETLEYAAVFSGDAYDNEMGYWLPEPEDEVL
jgi:hypothetical protein